MLDDWLERITREPPEKRAKGQLRDLGKATRDTVKALAKHPDDRLTGDILHTHKVRVAEIKQQGIKPPPKRCRICGRVLLGPPSDFWTNKLGLKLLWAVSIAVLFLSLGQFIDWWALVMFPIGWAVSLSFFWTITIPSLLLVFLALVLAFSGL
jgi:hypothetical protein